jgi:hypothetical protein
MQWVMIRSASGPRFTTAKLVGLVVATIAGPAIIAGLFVRQFQDDRAQAHGILGALTVSSCVQTNFSSRHPHYSCTGDFRADHQGLELPAISMATRRPYPAGSRVPAYVTGPHARSAGQEFNPATAQINDVVISVGMVVFLTVSWALLIRDRRRQRRDTGSMAPELGG